MKKAFLFCVIVYLSNNNLNAQGQVILDQTPQIGWPSSPSLNNIVVYDNDILYNINRSTNSFSPEVLLNYGKPNASIDINQEQKQQVIKLKMDVPFSLFRQFFDGSYYETGNEIFGQKVPNGAFTSNSVVQLNKSRTMFIPNKYGLKSIEKIDHHTVVGRDTIFDLQEPYFQIKLVQPNFQKIIKIPEIIYKNDGTYGGMFLHNNTLHFAISTAGHSEMFADGGFGEATRITNLQNGTNGTAPGYMTPTNDGIWFSGANFIETNTGTTEYKGRNLCYTNGSPDLYEIPAKGFGYIPVQINTTFSNGPYYISNPVVFGRVNGKIIYYDQTTSVRKMYAYSSNTTESLGVQSFVYDNSIFGFLNDKFYMTYSFKPGQYLPNEFKLIETDGTPSGTKEYELDEKVGRTFFIYKYMIYFFGDNKLVKFNPTSKQFEVVFEGEGSSISDVTPYQNGFVFTETDNQNGLLSIKLKGWNIEQRQVIHDATNSNKSANKNSITNYELKYNSNPYNVFIENLQITNADKLKIQFLDNNSNKKKYTIGNFQQENDEINATVFYSLNTFTDTNSYTGEISFGYHETMFPNLINFNASNLKVYQWQNGTTTQIPSILDETSKTLKINTSFMDESFIYFAYENGTLNLNSVEYEDVLELYPNPTSKFLNIKTTSKSVIDTIEIYNLLGKKVFTKNVNNSQNVEINVSNLSTGIYIVKVKSGNKIISKKLVIN